MATKSQETIYLLKTKVRFILYWQNVSMFFRLKIQICKNIMYLGKEIPVFFVNLHHFCYSKYYHKC